MAAFIRLADGSYYNLAHVRRVSAKDSSGGTLETDNGESFAFIDSFPGCTLQLLPASGAAVERLTFEYEAVSGETEMVPCVHPERVIAWALMANGAIHPVTMEDIGFSREMPEPGYGLRVCGQESVYDPDSFEKWPSVAMWLATKTKAEK